jgi:hypothetical protein
LSQRRGADVGFRANTGRKAARWGASALCHEATFAGSQKGCLNVRLTRKGGRKPAAIAYTLIETAKLNGVDPQAWLTDTTCRISDHNITRLDEFMPWRYAQ